MLATIAHLIDEGLTDAREQYVTLLQTRPTPGGHCSVGLQQ
jgi:hypothetical protein